MKRMNINTLIGKAVLTLFLISISLLMQGQFGEPNYLTHSAGMKINVADFDNDGDIDVIDGRRDYGREEFVIYENSDVIGHTWEISSIPGIFAKNCINGDFNNDGWEDLISIGSDSSGVYWNNGDNAGISFTFQPLNIPYAEIKDIGHINNDSVVDILVKETTLPRFSIIENHFAQGSFVNSYTSETLPTGWRFQNLRLHDVDGDSDLDVLAVLSSYVAPYSKEIVWYKNEDGMGTYGDKITIVTQSSCAVLGFFYDCATDVQMADFNGDNLLDIVYFDDSYVKFRTQLSNNDFSEVFDSIAVSSPNVVHDNHLIVGDIDNDGDIDVARAGIFISSFTWYKNIGGAFEKINHCCYDQSIGAFYESLGEQPSSHLEDIDNDGDLDILMSGTSGYTKGYNGIFSIINEDNGLNFIEPFKISENLNGPVKIIPHDLDEDGDNDLWLHDSANDRVLFQRNEDGLGNFSEPVPILVGLDFTNTVIGLDIMDIAIYDIDGNGSKDLVGVSTNGEDSELFYYEILDSIPTLSAKHVIHEADDLDFVGFEIKDINNDGLMDIGVQGLQEIHWYLRIDSTGTNFSFHHSGIPGNLIGFGDVNGDSLTDFFYSKPDNDNWSYDEYPWVAIQDPAGNFNPVNLTNELGFQSFLVTDLNEDGKSELLTGWGNSTINNSDRIILFSYDSLGVQEYEIFSSNGVLNGNDPFFKLTTEDIDNDGKLDIVWGRNWFKQLSSHLDFSSRFQISVGSRRINIITDLNNDGKKDLIFDGETTFDDAVYWLENQLDEVYWVQGNIARDENENCEWNDSTDIGLSNWIIQLKKDGNSYFTNTNSLGNYATYLVDTGEYIIDAIIPSNYWEPCFSDSTIQVFDSTITNIVNIPIDALVDCPLLGLSDAATNLRPCIPGKIIYKYCNYGTALAEDAQLEILIDEFLNIDTTNIPILITTDSSLIFDLGDLDIGECGELQLFVTPDCDSTMLGDVLCTQAYITPDFVCEPLNSSWDGSTIAVDGFCTNDSITFTIENVGFGDMAIPRDFRVQIVNDEIVMLIFQDTFQLISGQIKTLTVANNQEPLQIEADQDFNHPTFSTASILVSHCSGLTPMELANLINNFPDSDGNPFSEHLCITLSASYDPNAKEATPLGVSDQNYIDQDWELDYTIHFQNTGNDYAFNVVIVDTISEDLDLSTLRIGAGSHNFDWKLNSDRSIIFTFPDIYLPDSTTNLLESQGFVQFFITPRFAVLPGTEIVNRASIYFDSNEPILTNEVNRKVRPLFYSYSEHLQLCEGEEFLDQVMVNDTMMIDTISNGFFQTVIKFYHLHVTPAEVSIDTTVQLGDIYNGVVITQDTVFESFYVDDNGCETSVFVNVLLPVDIFDLELGNEIHIYPNPTSHQIFIEKEDARIKLNRISIRNVSGIIVKEIQTVDFAERKIRLDISDLLSGVYMIEINTDLGIIFKKMIVVK